MMSESTAVEHDVLVVGSRTRCLSREQQNMMSQSSTVEHDVLIEYSRAISWWRVSNSPRQCVQGRVLQNDSVVKSKQLPTAVCSASLAIIGILSAELTCFAERQKVTDRHLGNEKRRGIRTVTDLCSFIILLEMLKRTESLPI